MAGDKRINGLDVGRLEESMEGMRDNPGLGRYVFRVRNEWVEGAHCRTMKNDFGKIFSRLFKFNNYKPVKANSFLSHEPNENERLIQESTSAYNPYMLSEPVFDRTNTDTVLAGSKIELPLMNLSYFKKLLDYAYSVKWR